MFNFFSLLFFSLSTLHNVIMQSFNVPFEQRGEYCYCPSNLTVAALCALHSYGASSGPARLPASELSGP